MNNNEAATKSTEAKHEWVMDPNRTIDMRCLKCGWTAYNLDVHSIPVPASWTDEDIATWGTPLSEMVR
jgi:hypothetical protein